MEKRLRTIITVDSGTREEMRIKLSQDALDFFLWFKTNTAFLDDLDVYEMDVSENEYDYVEE